MKVLLTHGYFLSEDPVEARIMKPYPPLGILYLSAWLNKEDIQNRVFDSTFLNLSDLKSELLEYRPDITGIYSTLMTKKNVIRIIAYIKETPELKHSRIIIGGPDARHHASNYLELGADIVIPGEGELALTDAVRAFENEGSGNMNIPGIIFRRDDGLVAKNNEPGLIDLDLLPLPALEKIDIAEYQERWKTAHGYNSIAINSMRGCPYSCNWCSKSVFSNTYRRKNPELVAKELLLLRNKYQPDQVWFTDDVFTISRKWLRKFLREVKNLNISLPYECISRSDCLDEEILNLLAGSGCRKLWIGSESGSQKVISLMNRKVDVEYTISILKKAREKNIRTGTFIMLGYPGEQKQDILKTAEYLRRSAPDDMTIGMAYPIKGTRFYDETETYFLNPFNWKEISEREISFKKIYSNRFYWFAIRYLVNVSEYTRTKIRRAKYISWMKAFIARIFIRILN
jgi:radical SAM superfamily enzyme YgiQ (UPF0313 family)